MKFNFRKACVQDLSSIMEIMEECKNNMEDPEWFVADNINYVMEHIENKGFVVIAETEEKVIAGFFIIKCLGNKEELTHFLSYSEEKTKESAIMDSACVRIRFRGNSLQRKMLSYAEKLLDKEQYHYFICTVHPDNVSSLESMKKSGYKIKDSIKCYNGLNRYLLAKEI